MINKANIVLKTQIGMTKQEFIKTFSEKETRVFNYIDSSKDGTLQKEELATYYYKTADIAKAKAFLSTFAALGAGLTAGNSKSTTMKYSMGALAAGNALNTIDDAQLADIATQKLKVILPADEYTAFMKKMKDPTIGESIAAFGNNVADWWTDRDKTCTDNIDDGNIGFAEGAKSYLKGLFGGVVKTAVKNPLATLATLGAAAGITVLTGVAALPVLVGLGAVGAGAGLVKGIKDAANAENDAQAKQAFENMGTSTTALALAGLGVKAAGTQAAKAGVTSLNGIEQMSYTQALKTTLKSVPECLKVSGQNAKANILTATTGTVRINSYAEKGMNNVKYADPKTGETAEIIHIRGDQAGTQFKTADGVQTVKAGDIVVKMNNEFKIMPEEQFLKDVFNIAKIEKPVRTFDPAFRDYDMVYKVTTTDGNTKTLEIASIFYDKIAHNTSLLEQFVTFQKSLH